MKRVNSSGRTADTHAQPPAMDGEFEIVKAQELSPVAPQNGKSFSVLVGSDAVQLHNLFHRRGMLAAAQAGCWFVLAGVELARRKKAVGHGGWQEWVEDNCEFNVRTARNYMALAEGVKNKALRDAVKTTAEDLIALLEKPAGLLSETEQLALLKNVHKLTDGATLSQLYLDFGIIKKPQGSGTKGGQRDATAETDPNAAVEVARDLLVAPLRKVGTYFEEHWMHLPFDEMQEIDGLLMDWRNKIKQALKGKEQA